MHSSIIKHLKNYILEILLHCIAQCFFNKSLKYKTIKEFALRELPKRQFRFVKAMFTTINKLKVIDLISKLLQSKLLVYL
jgi:hypothetical protein